MLAPTVAHFEVVDVQLARELAGCLRERGMRSLVRRNDAAVDAEWRRDQGVAEQQALDVRERQHTANLAALGLRQEIVGWVPERALQHVLPFGEVEERALGMRLDKSVPRGAIRQREGTDYNRAFRWLEAGLARSSGWGDGSSPAIAGEDWGDDGDSTRWSAVRE